MTNTPNPIAALNDAIRRSGPFSSVANGQWMLTAGVIDRGQAFASRVILAVMTFDAFTPDNDPYGEHDFGSLEVADQRVFWKIDYYDVSLECGSPDPADISVTRRVLTIMLASEY